MALFLATGALVPAPVYGADDDVLDPAPTGVGPTANQMPAVPTTTPLKSHEHSGPTAGPPAAPAVAVLPPDASTGTDYRLNYGDQIVIQVFRQPDLQFTGVVPPSGSIMFPMLGSMQVEAKTTNEIAQEIGATLRHDEYVTAPFVTVQVTALAATYVYARGAVAHPAAVQLPVGQAMRLTQLLAAVGGVIDGQAYKDRVQLIHYAQNGASATTTTVDVEDLESNYDYRRDPILQPGDEVYVPPMVPPRVIVLGAVTQAQTVDIPEGRKLTLSEAIAKCGGLADKSDSEVVDLQLASAPGGKMMTINLQKILDGTAPDFELADGDRVYVPTIDGIVVSGQVKEPGVVYGRPGEKMTVTRALSMSGGFISYASRNEVYVIKRGSMKPIQVDVGTILKTGDMSTDVELSPGDVVIVPEGIW
ncbi:MAG: SLBB domain-containing protein [Planctomycetota bacterium]